MKKIVTPKPVEPVVEKVVEKPEEPLVLQNVIETAAAAEAIDRQGAAHTMILDEIKNLIKSLPATQPVVDGRKITGYDVIFNRDNNDLIQSIRINPEYEALN